LLVYVGTYTTNNSKGIYLYRLHWSSGELELITSTSGVTNPSFLAIAPGRRHLYAVNEVEEFAGQQSGAVSAFAIDQRTGELRLLNQQASRGGAPCYLVVDRTGKFVLVANYSGGNVAVLPIRVDGGLGAASDVKQDIGSSVNPARQTGPHAHCIVLDPQNRFAYVCDLGTDKIMVYGFDRRRGKLNQGAIPWVKANPGAGPRHLTFHPGGRYAYVINELNETVTVFLQDQSQGYLREIQTVATLSGEVTSADTGADIHASPDGRFLYCSNRGHDSITAFMIHPQRGTLTLIDHVSTGGKTPRNFAIDPTGTFLLVGNQNSNNILTFRLDPKTGLPRATGGVVELPSPVCIKF